MQQLARNGLRSQRRSGRPVPRPELGSERPVLDRELVRREALLDWFSVHRAEAVVAIFAPAGYGKTPLLGQADEADERPVGWVSLHDRDNDPLELMSHLASALDQLARAGPAIFDRLQGWPSESWSSAIPRLAAAFASRERPAVFVLDDVHVLENGTASRSSGRSALPSRTARSWWSRAALSHSWGPRGCAPSVELRSSADTTSRLTRSRPARSLVLPDWTSLAGTWLS